MLSATCDAAAFYRENIMMTYMIRRFRILQRSNIWRVCFFALSSLGNLVMGMSKIDVH